MPKDLDQWVMDAKQGSSYAFDAIVSALEVDLYRLCYRMMGNEHDAQDTLQDAFLTLYQKLYQYSNKSSFQTWAYRVTLNTCYNALARRKHFSNQEHIEISSLEIEDSLSVSPEETLIRQDKAMLIQHCLDKLPDQYRSVIILRDFQELSYDDVAQSLRLSLPTVKNRLFRARQRLKKLLEESGYDL